MSARKWKAGDVARVAWTTSRGRPRVDTCLRQASGDWLNAEGLRIDPYDATLVRQFFVIDPEDREQVRAVLEAFGTQFSSWQPELDQNVTRLQAALRSILAPPKPDEPTAMWAVVVDSHGDHWVRVLGADFADGWARAADLLSSNGKWHHYSDIVAVRVLSPGVDQ